MITFVLVLAAPALVGAALALVWWAVRERRDRVPVARSTRVGTIVASLLLAVVMLAATAIGVAPLFGARALTDMTAWLVDVRFLLPLAVGIVGLVIVGIPTRRQLSAPSADLTRRTLGTFASVRGVVLVAVLAGVALVAALAAGSVSTPDERGRYVFYVVDNGVSLIGTNIYGWYYSIPCLVLIAVLAVGVVADLALLSRPPLGPDPESDLAARRWRGRNLTALAAGALAFHLSEVLTSLAGSASVHGQARTEHGYVTVFSPFAAFDTAFTVLGRVFDGFGFLLCVLILLRALTQRASRRGE